MTKSLKILTVLAMLGALAPPAGAAPPPAGGTDIHARALAALPEVRATLLHNLPSYADTRFRNVHARIVRSIWSTDDGHADRVPHRARGGPVLIICGELMDHHGLYFPDAWRGFYVEPTQTDMQRLRPAHGAHGDRRPGWQNVAQNSHLTVADYQVERADVRILCGAPERGAIVDPADLSALVSAGPP